MQGGRNFYGLFAGIAGFLGIVLGAAAAHKAKDAHIAALLHEASLYALIHSALLMAICHRTDKISCLACFLLTLGMLLFCGGIAIKAFIAAHFSLWLIPYGGGCLMLGWLAAGAGFLARPGK